MSENIFEKATRLKVRFPFKGNCTVEDLWDLSLENLDTMYSELDGKLKDQKGASLLKKKNKETELIDLKMNVIKHIVVVQMQEAEERKQAKQRKKKNEKIKEIIEEKENASLRDKSIDELKRLMDGEEK